MPCSGCSALHGVNPNFLKEIKEYEDETYPMKHPKDDFRGVQVILL